MGDFGQRVVKRDVSASALDTIYTAPADKNGFIKSIKLVHQNETSRFTVSNDTAFSRSFFPGFRPYGGSGNTANNMGLSAPIDATRVLVLTNDFYRQALYAQIIERDPTTGAYYKGPVLYLVDNTTSVDYGRMDIVLMSATKVAIASWNHTRVFSLTIDGLNLRLIGSLVATARIAPLSSTKVVGMTVTGSNHFAQVMSVPDSGNPAFVGSSVQVATGSSSPPYLTKAQNDANRYATVHYVNGTTLAGGYFSVDEPTNVVTAGVTGTLSGTALNTSSQLGILSFSEGSDFSAVIYAVDNVTLRVWTGTNFASWAHATTTASLAGTNNLSAANYPVKASNTLWWLMGSNSSFQLTKNGTTATISSEFTTNPYRAAIVLPYTNLLTFLVPGQNGRSAEFTHTGTAWGAFSKFVYVPVGATYGRLIKWNPVYNVWCVADRTHVWYLTAKGVPIGHEAFSTASMVFITSMDLLPNGNVLLAVTNMDYTNASSSNSATLEVFTPAVLSQGSTTTRTLSSLPNNMSIASTQHIIHDCVAVNNSTFYAVSAAWNGASSFYGIYTGFASLTAWSATQNKGGGWSSAGYLMVNGPLTAAFANSETVVGAVYATTNGSTYTYTRITQTVGSSSDLTTTSLFSNTSDFTRSRAVTAFAEIFRHGTGYAYYNPLDRLIIVDGTSTIVSESRTTDATALGFAAIFTDVHIVVAWAGTNGGVNFRFYNRVTGAIDYSVTNADPTTVPRQSVFLNENEGVWELVASSVDRVVTFPGAVDTTVDIYVSEAGTDHIIYPAYSVGTGTVSQADTLEILNPGESLKMRASRQWQVTAHVNVLER